MKARFNLKIVIMGVQGCGKGTQAKLLRDKYDLVHISVGDIFRWNIQNHTKLAARVKRIITAGQLVPDEVVEEIVSRRLQEHDWNYGFILDGFPRNQRQAEFFLESYNIDHVIHVDVPDPVVLERVMSRRLCSSCGLDYNLIHHRPAVADRCDVCGGRLVARADDNEEAVRARLSDYHTKTEPALHLFQREGVVLTVDGTCEASEVHTQIIEALNLPNLEALTTS